MGTYSGMALNWGGHLLHFPLNEIENGGLFPGKFMRFAKSAAIGQKLKKR